MRENLHRFFRAARGAGVRLSPAESIDAMRAVSKVGFADRTILRDTFLLTLAKTQDEKKALGDCFDLFFDQPEPQPPKPDPIADKIKQPDQPKQQTNVEQPLPPKKPPQKQQPKFDADRIAALLDKRDPSRNAATGLDPNTMPSLGTPTGMAAKLSQSEIDALRARLMALWSPPVGVQDPNELIVNVTVKLLPNGRLAGPPFARVNGRSVAAMASRDSAVRAVLTGQPFDMLRPEHYDSWKEIELTFDPKDMFRSN